jgi:hypothetical protein
MKKEFSIGIVVVVMTILAALATVLAQNSKAGKKTGTEGTAQGNIGQAAPKGATVIGHLESKDRVITVSQGTKGPLYTITTKEGKVLASKMDEKSLQAKYPDLYHQVKDGVAGNDARLDAPPRR